MLALVEYWLPADYTTRVKCNSQKVQTSDAATVLQLLQSGRGIAVCHPSTQQLGIVCEGSLSRRAWCGVRHTVPHALYSSRAPLDGPLHTVRAPLHIVSSIMAETMSPSAALSAFTAFGLLTPAYRERPAYPLLVTTSGMIK